MWLSMVLRAAQPRIAPLKAAVSGVANAPDGAFFYRRDSRYPPAKCDTFVINMFVISCSLRQLAVLR